MKSKLLLLIIFGVILSQPKLYSQSLIIDNIIKFLDYETIKVLTPLGNQPNPNTNIILTNEWTSAQIQQSIEASIYTGGLFKRTTDDKFYEKNIDIPKRTGNCVLVDNSLVLIGTDEGIYKSTDKGDTWQNPDIDEMENLPSRKINALHKNENTYYAGTDNGIYYSTFTSNNGIVWNQAQSGKNISSIASLNSNEVFIGITTGDNTSPHVYKSTDNGQSWSSMGLNYNVNCLKFDNNGILFAGTKDGNFYLWKLSTLWTGMFNTDAVVSIYFDNNNICVGTERGGCHTSTNDGVSWVEINDGNINEYYLQHGYYPSINSIEKFNNKIYIATNDGLYSRLSTTEWSLEYVRDNYYSINDVMIDKNIKNLYINSNDELWIVCTGYKFWNSNEPILDGSGLFEPKYFSNYTCHPFSWHLIEGGTKFANISTPFEMRYLPPNNVDPNNWDYIETEWDNQMNKPEKVTYSGSHSGIIIYNPFTTASDLTIFSKWSSRGPLVTHKLINCPYINEDINVQFWTSRKLIEKDASNFVTNSQMIGRELFSESTTTIENGVDIEFYVAPMYNHKIHLKSGFHAKPGSKLHVYVKDYYYDENNAKKPCRIPWEEESTLLSSILLTINDPVDNTLVNGGNKQTNSNKYSTILDTIPCKQENYEFKFSGKGSGTEIDPYQITTIKQLYEINNDYDGDRFWILMNDIDASETRYWMPIVDNNGDTIRYDGSPNINGNNINTLDGNGFVIRNIYLPIGRLFGRLNCLTIKSLGFENIIIDSLISWTKIGLFENSPGEKDFRMEECYFKINIKNKFVDNWGVARIHFNFNNIIKNCYIDWGDLNPEKLMRAFGGFFEEGIGSFENCYATGKIKGKDVRVPFGYYGIVNACFWDADKIKVTDTLVGKGLGLSTADMMKRHTFESAGWDFENVWYIDEGMDYPKLKVFKRDTTSVISDLTEYKLSIYPNPASDYIEIGIPPLERGSGGVARVRIFDILGIEQSTPSVLRSATPQEGNIRIDVSYLQPGMYFVKLGNEVRKFVKM